MIFIAHTGEESGTYCRRAQSQKTLGTAENMSKRMISLL
jgi:hypothetical protein